MWAAHRGPGVHIPSTARHSAGNGSQRSAWRAPCAATVPALVGRALVSATTGEKWLGKVGEMLYFFTHFPPVCSIFRFGHFRAMIQFPIVQRRKHWKPKSRWAYASIESGWGCAGHEGLSHVMGTRIGLRGTLHPTAVPRPWAAAFDRPCQTAIQKPPIPLTPQSPCGLRYPPTLSRGSIRLCSSLKGSG